MTVIFITLAEIIAVAIALAMVLSFAKSAKRRALVIGLLGDVSGVVMYAAPLSVMIPNGTGCILGLAQLILYATYYKSTKAQMAARKASNKLEMGLKEVVIVTKEPNKVNSLPQNDGFSPKLIAK
ncbi:hypothetical protein KSS87_004978 [Heliosperma pusillum]|nr:hypothetical protein KSS87_004978 [Heliosperma pusillum]